MTVLTTDPNGVVDRIHNRIPVVLPQKDEIMWLAADGTNAGNCATRIQAIFLWPT